jgi:hypothetical protein
LRHKVTSSGSLRERQGLLPGTFKSIADPAEEDPVDNRLLDEVDRPGANRADRRGDIGLAGQQDCGHLSSALTQFMEQFQPIHAGELEAGDQDFHRQVIERIQQRFRGGEGSHPVLEMAQQLQQSGLFVGIAHYHTDVRYLCLSAACRDWGHVFPAGQARKSLAAPWIESLGESDYLELRVLKLAIGKGIRTST